MEAGSRPLGNPGDPGSGNGIDNGISNGILDAMKGTVSIDKSGRVVFPQKVREQLRLEPGTVMEFEVTADKIEFRPLEESNYRVVNKNGLMVMTGGEPMDIVGAIKATRQERIDKLENRDRP